MGKVDTGWLMQVPRFREFCNYMICELRIHEWLGLFSLYTGWLSLHGIDSALLVDVEWTMYYENFLSVLHLGYLFVVIL